MLFYRWVWALEAETLISSQSYYKNGELFRSLPQSFEFDIVVLSLRFDPLGNLPGWNNDPLPILFHSALFECRYLLLQAFDFIHKSFEHFTRV